MVITHTAIYNKKKVSNFAHKVYLCVRMTVQINNQFSYTTLIFTFPTETLCTSCDATPNLRVYRMLMKFKF